jgi:hypothetical protein
MLHQKYQSLKESDPSVDRFSYEDIIYIRAGKRLTNMHARSAVWSGVNQSETDAAHIGTDIIYDCCYSPFFPSKHRR